MDKMIGKVWVLGDDIDTDIIIPTEYLALKTIDDMKQYGFSPLRPELAAQIKPGDIIVTKDTNNDMMEEIRKASGLIVEAEGANTHAGIVGLSLDLPVILGAKNAVQILKTGAYVTLDGRRGTVSCNREHEEEK